MTRVSQKGQSILDRAASLSGEIREIRRKVMAEAEAEVTKRTLVKTTELSILANQAQEERVPVTRFARAIGKNFQGVKELQALTHEEYTATPVDTEASSAHYSIGTDGLLRVVYDNHGSENISGAAVFTLGEDENGQVLYSETPLFNEDYSDRNMVVTRLDLATEGDNEYIDEALAWLRSQ